MYNFTPLSKRTIQPFISEAESKAQAQAAGLRTAPSSKTLTNILAFSKAIEVKTLESGRACELVMN